MLFSCWTLHICLTAVESGRHFGRLDLALGRGMVRLISSRGSTAIAETRLACIQTAQVAISQGVVQPKLQHWNSNYALLILIKTISAALSVTSTPRVMGRDSMQQMVESMLWSGPAIGYERGSSIERTSRAVSHRVHRMLPLLVCHEQTSSSSTPPAARIAPLTSSSHSTRLFSTLIFVVPPLSPIMGTITAQGYGTTARWSDLLTPRAPAKAMVAPMRLA